MADAARSALAKVVAVMSPRDRAAAEELAARIRFFEPREEDQGRVAVPLVLQRALAARRVLRIDYADSRGNTSSRVVEPLGFLGGEHWYLVAWCRLRDATRGFRLDRIGVAEELDETVPPRSIDIDALDVLGRTLVGLNVTANTDITVSRGR
jgi:predicted DNA-binding transcriptional regulator YafY